MVRVFDIYYTISVSVRI